MAEKRRKKSEGASGGGGSWALSYGDLMTLLLTFFVLIVSFSTTELIKFRKAMGSLRGSMGVLLEQDGAAVVERQTKSSSPDQQTMQQKMLQQQLKTLQEAVFAMDLDQGVSIEQKEGGIIFRLQSSLLFGLGSAEVNPILYPLLDRIGLILLLFGTDIRVEGHTDDLPVTGGLYANNWEISTARAYSVAKYFIEQVHIDPTRLIISGRGQHKELVPNTGPENRAKNRRVEILVDINEYKAQ